MAGVTFSKVSRDEVGRRGPHCKASDDCLKHCNVGYGACIHGICNCRGNPNYFAAKD
ncbi:unnamed protein product, partial [Ilex paraguariensis]